METNSSYIIVHPEGNRNTISVVCVENDQEHFYTKVVAARFTEWSEANRLAQDIANYRHLKYLARPSQSKSKFLEYTPPDPTKLLLNE